ncbi:hypothetical protein WISP_119723 [Willisornis vidua]|uniref:Secreted protein n=1 Tax=Willisornis vidua TaxID=1566151 RepID=A0ABQ9CY30_9PASS|nr:hypothetical protein WISP_119723 [Willisornis vidua]
MLCLMPPWTWLALLGARALLTYIQLSMNKDAQLPFHDSAFQHPIPQSVCTSGVAPSEVQNPALPLLNFMWLVIAKSSNLLRSLQGLSAFEGVNSSSHLCVICKLAWYLFQSCIQVIYEDVEVHRAQDGALQKPTSHKSPVCHPFHYCPLCLTHEPVAHPAHDVFIPLYSDENLGCCTKHGSSSQQTHMATVT